MNQTLNPLNLSQLALESPEIKGIESDGTHRNAHLSVAWHPLWAFDLLQDLWSAESPVLDRSTHGYLLGFTRQRFTATASN
jgi:hypothetical protein